MFRVRSGHSDVSRVPLSSGGKLLVAKNRERSVRKKVGADGEKSGGGRKSGPKIRRREEEQRKKKQDVLGYLDEGL